jgi:hypothetical protein
MGDFVSKLMGASVQGPSKAEQAAQLDAQTRAAEQTAEAERLAALSAKVSSRRSSLSFSDRKGTLGG